MISSGIKNQQAFGCSFRKQGRVAKKAGVPEHFLISFLFFAIAHCFSFTHSAQEEILINGQPCDMDGNAKREDVAELNRHKNRYVAPGRTDFQTTVTLDALLKSDDPNSFSQEKATVLRGYVYNVMVGGVETCNCKTKETQYRDTHIELTPDSVHTAAQYRVIVEVTPRQRMMMANRGVDWSTTALRKNIKGRRVEVAGWLTYDSEHETAAYANDPDNAVGEKNWRATCWEVHPITYLKVIQKGANSPLSAIIREQAGEVKAKRDTERNMRTDTTPGDETPLPSSQTNVWLVIGGLLVFVVLFFLLKNKRR
jgi:hypothetical protein